MEPQSVDAATKHAVDAQLSTSDCHSQKYPSLVSKLVTARRTRSGSA
jgi:hypothetical protein